MGTKVSEIQHPVNRRESFVFKAVNSQEVEQKGSLRGPYIFQISFSGKQRNTRIWRSSGAFLSTNTILGRLPTDPLTQWLSGVTQAPRAFLLQPLPCQTS